MKTTVELPDALAEEAKRVAQEQGVSFRELMVSGLRAEIERRRDVATVDFVFPTVGGRGLAIDVNPDEVTHRSYGLSPTIGS